MTRPTLLLLATGLLACAHQPLDQTTPQAEATQLAATPACASGTTELSGSGYLDQSYDTRQCHDTTSPMTLCTTTTCATYEERVAALKLPGACKTTPFNEPGPGYPAVYLGLCGADRVIAYNESLEEYLEFYDASGALVGAQRVSDTTEFCGQSSSSNNVGVVPSCTLRLCEVACMAPPAT